MLQSLRKRLTDFVPPESLVSLSVRWTGDAAGSASDEHEKNNGDDNDDAEDGESCADDGICVRRHKSYLRRFCDSFCEKMVWRIIEAANNRKV